jgi:hypothetical protein
VPDAKPAIASVTLWGLLFSMICTVCPAVAGWLHLSDPATQAAIVTLAGQIGTVVGLAIALYGRLRAVGPIAGLISTPTPTPSVQQVASVVETVAADLAAPPKPPGATLSALAFICMIGLALIGSGLMTACATTSATSTTTSASSLQLDEGKALATIETASDALAVALDAGAKSGAISGAAATSARQALMNLQVGFSLAQQAYLAQDGTTAQKIAALATLLDNAEQALPVSASTSAEVDAAIAAAVAIANANAY